MKTIGIWKNCLSHKSIFFCGRKYGGQKYYLFGTKLCLCHQSVYDTQELNIKPIYHGTHILENAYKNVLQASSKAFFKCEISKSFCFLGMLLDNEK